jgi:hypothetical protein
MKANGNACIVSSILVAADGEGVASEFSVLQNEVHEDGADSEYPEREGNSEQIAVAKERERVWNFMHRQALRNNKRETTIGFERSEGDNEWADSEARDHEAVEEAA